MGIGNGRVALWGYLEHVTCILHGGKWDDQVAINDTGLQAAACTDAHEAPGAGNNEFLKGNRRAWRTDTVRANGDEQVVMMAGIAAISSLIGEEPGIF